MIIFTEPKVFLLARPSIDVSNLAEFITECNYTLKEKVPNSNADALVELGGRQCYCSFGKLFTDNISFLKHAIGLGHGSIMEHPNFTFGVTRCSRGYTHQQVRHRAGFAYSQESTHYIKYNKDAARFYVDKYALKEDKERWETALTSALEQYEIMFKILKDASVERHNSSGAARQLLPQAIESKLIFTANIRAIRHLIEDRCNKHNTLEIRLVAAGVLKLMKFEAPASFQDMELYKDDDEEASVKSGKVKL